MKSKYIILPLLCVSMAMAAQNHNNKHQHAEDSTDVFYRHLQLNELTVTGVTGDTKLKHVTAPVSIVSPQVLRATASTNVIDAPEDLISSVSGKLGMLDGVSCKTTYSSH